MQNINFYHSHALRWLVPLIGLTFIGNATANSSVHQISLSYDLPTAGQLNIDEDPLLGVEYRRYLTWPDSLQSFAAAGFKTDTDNVGIATDIFYADIGMQYDFATFSASQSFVELSLGATYGIEEYSIELIDREVSDSTSEFGIKTSFAIGHKFNNGFGLVLGLNEFSQGISGRTLSLNFTYAF